MSQDGFLRLAGILGELLKLTLRRATDALGVWKIASKVLSAELPNLLVGEELLLPAFRSLAPCTRQGESPPQIFGGGIPRSNRAWASARLYRASATWGSMPNSAPISFQENPS